MLTYLLGLHLTRLKSNDMAAITAVDLPTTLEDRLKLGTEPYPHPAEWSHYLDLLERVEYPIEYTDETIYALSYAEPLHEKIIARLIQLLAGLDSGTFDTYSSNHHILHPDGPRAFAPDVSVVKGNPKIEEVKKGIYMTTNPWMVIEVLSDTTRAYDLGTKLPRYREIESIRYVLYVE